MLLLPGFLVLLAVFTVDGVFREARDEEFPFQVAIQNTERRHLCGGIIIVQRCVLTSSSCLKSLRKVKVVYGSADFNRQYRTVFSEEIKHERVYIANLKSRLALIQLQSPIELLLTASQASLPMCLTVLRNTTELSGWNLEEETNGHPPLYASDTYYILHENCKTSIGGPVKLEFDEFCGMEKKEQNELPNPGAVVSKSSIALGMLLESPQFGMPQTFVKLSSHKQ